MIAKHDEYKAHSGFCSQECAQNAVDTLLIKADSEIDPMDYKKLRGKIKRYPELREELEEQMRANIKKQLENISYNHTTSQKEDFVID